MDPSCLMQELPQFLRDGDRLCTSILFPEDLPKFQRFEAGEDKGGKTPASDPPVIQALLIRESMAEVFQGDGTPPRQQGIENSAQALTDTRTGLARNQPGDKEQNRHCQVFEYLDRLALFSALFSHGNSRVGQGRLRKPVSGGQAVLRSCYAVTSMTVEVACPPMP